MGTSRKVIVALCGLGGLAAATGVWGAYEQHRRIRTWTEVPAVVTQSESYVHRSETLPRIRYRYRVDGVDYESGHLMPGPYSGGHGGSVRDWLARFPVGAATPAWHDPRRPGSSFLIPFHSFAPYVLFLMAVPFFALATGVATRGVDAESSMVPPTRRPDGWWEVPVFRGWLAMRNASLLAWAMLMAAGFFAFVDYFAKEARPELTSFVVLLLWLGFVVRLGWSVVKRTAVARRLAEARVFVSAPVPTLGRPFAVRVEQEAPRGVLRGTRVRALEAALVCEETSLRRKGPPQAKTAWKETVILGRDVVARAERPAAGEGSFEVPTQVGRGEGFLRWRVEVRSRLLGPDYRTRFPLVAPDDED